MKRIWTDFNHPDMKNFQITKMDIEYFDLKECERILFYCNDIEVEAIVFYDENKDQWFGKIDSEFVDTPQEIITARIDGFDNGRLFGIWTERNNIIRSMLKHGISKELIMQITKTNEDDLRGLSAGEYIKGQMFK